MKIEVGDVVQLDPEKHEHQEGFWAAQLLIVTEVKAWGVVGFAKVQGGDAYYRASFGTFERVGRATWVPEEQGA